MNFVKKIKPFFKDRRGEMSYLLGKDISIKSVLIVTCKKGSIRANHYHKKDTHYSYMIKGEMEYFSRPVNSKSQKLKKVVVYSGEVVETPPMTIHAMRFLKNSVFLALTTETRDRAKYEQDTIRLKVI